MQIFVKIPMEKTVVLEVESSDTINKVKVGEILLGKTDSTHHHHPPNRDSSMPEALLECSGRRAASTHYCEEGHVAPMTTSDLPAVPLAVQD